MIDDDFEDYCDGPLRLRTFLRVWARDRWARVRAFVWYRLLRRPRPKLKPAPGGCADLASLAHIYKQAYPASRVMELAGEPTPLMVPSSSPGGPPSPDVLGKVVFSSLNKREEPPRE